MNSQFQQMFTTMENTMRGLEQQMNQLRGVFGQPQPQTPYGQNPYPQYQNARSPNQLTPLTVIDILTHGDDKLLVKSATGNVMTGDVVCTRQEILMHLSNTGSIGTQISTMVLNNPMLAGLGLRGWIITDNQAILTVPMIGSAVFDPTFIQTLPCVAIKDLRVVKNSPTAVTWISNVSVKEPGKFEVTTVSYGNPTPKTLTMSLNEFGSGLDKIVKILDAEHFNSPMLAGHTSAWILDDRNAVLSTVTLGSCMIHPEALAKIPGVRLHDLRPKQAEECKENGDAVNPVWVAEMEYLGDDRWSVKQVTVANDDSSPAFVSGLNLKETVVEHNIESLMELGVGDEYQSLQFDSLIAMAKPENLKVWKLNSEYVLISIELFGCSVYEVGVLDAIEGISFIDVSTANTSPVENTPYVYSRKNRKHDLANLSIDSAELINDPTSNFNQHYRFTFLPNNPSEAKVTVLVPKKDVAYLLDAECSTITAQGLHAMVRRQNAAATNQSTFTVVDIESVGQCLVQVLNGDVRNNYYLPSKSALKAFTKLEDDTYLRQFAI